MVVALKLSEMGMMNLQENAKKSDMAVPTDGSGAGKSILPKVKAILLTILSTLARTFQEIKGGALRQWRRFIATKTGRTVISLVGFLCKLWNRRIRFSYAFYAIVLVLLSFAAMVGLQWSVYVEPTYSDPNAVDENTKAFDSIAGQITRFVSQIWLFQRYNALLNLLILALIYITMVFIINRFWIATALFSTIMTAFAMANRIKAQLRNEPIIPSDLSFLSGGNGAEIWSFIPTEDLELVNAVIAALVWAVVICLALQVIDRRTSVIPTYWRHPLRGAGITRRKTGGVKSDGNIGKKTAGEGRSGDPAGDGHAVILRPKTGGAAVIVRTVGSNCLRLVAVFASAATLISFTWNLGVPGSWSYAWAASMGDTPMLWDSISDSRNNGPAMNFLRLAHAKTMEKPDGYDKHAMEELAAKYAAAADVTNQSRANNLTDSTVIMILSETFSDPTRVPGIAMTEDPMPNIRAIKDATTSGLMLSPGYGGGTANIEYQSLTGLNLGLFDDSMQSPYQELVPHQKSPYTFNQIWNDAYGEGGSIAFHPYYKNMYLRDSDYKKFGFSRFLTLDSSPAITHQDRIDASPVVSDAASYQNIIDALNDGTDHARFIQMVTMQNHMPYNDWYADNQFKTADISTLGDAEKLQVDTYTKGISLTDQSTAVFLAQLDQMDRPITVIFYGDHLPGIYETAAADKNNTLALHETDYFIWSNQASASGGVKIMDANTGYTSSNFFMPLAAQHMGAKVSPYLELLSELRAEVPALGRLVMGAGGFDTSMSTAYLDADGNAVPYQSLSSKAKALLDDYRLVQYDLTAGKGYLADTGFLKVG